MARDVKWNRFMRVHLSPALRFCFLLVTGATAVACGPAPSEPGGAGGAGAAGGSLPCAVDHVLGARCRTCHAASPLFGAPMPLVTYADLTRQAVSDRSRKVYELVGERTRDAMRPMPPPPNQRLDDADQNVVDDWIAGGALSGAACGGGAGGAGGDGGATALSCTPDVHLKPMMAYTMPKDVEDQYVCYGIDVDVQAKRHITAFAPDIDDATIVHHIVLFQSDTTAPAGPELCDLGGATGWRIVAVWAPGVKPFELPPEAGVPLEGTAHYIVQVHYSNLQHLAGESDRSGFDLCTTSELRPNDADVLAFGSLSFDIPAHGKLDTTCDFQLPANAPSLHLIASMPHMHKLGTAISTLGHPKGGGAPTDLGTRVPWDFNSQVWSQINAVVAPGDVVSTRCAFENSTSNDVHWGETTSDEMCWSFTMYYPKITQDKWNWTLPSALSKCTPTQ